MDLAEIFTNPLIWGLLAWLFSRLFSSKKKEEEVQKTPPKNSQQQSNRRRETQPRVNPNPNPVKVEQKSRNKEKVKLQTVQEAYEKLKTQAVETPNRIKIVENRPKRYYEEKSATKVNGNVNNLLKIDRNKAIQGVIWSEILGSPRSKNPHYTRNRRQL